MCENEYPTIGSILEWHVICNDSSSLKLPRELRKIQWLDGLSGTLCKALRALFVDKRYVNALFNINVNQRSLYFSKLRYIRVMLWIRFPDLVVFFLQIESGINRFTYLCIRKGNPHHGNLLWIYRNVHQFKANWVLLSLIKMLTYNQYKKKPSWKHTQHLGMKFQLQGHCYQAMNLNAPLGVGEGIIIWLVMACQRTSVRAKSTFSGFQRNIKKPLF